MLADFFTKPLQGSLFRDMRDVAQGIADYDVLTDKYNRSAIIEEKCDDNYYMEDHNKIRTEEEDSSNVPILYGNGRKERVEINKNN